MDCSVLDDLVRQAETKFRSGDLRGAYDDARRVLSETRTNGRAHYLMSCLATLKGAHADSLKLCQIAITLDGPSAKYLGQLATCHFHLGALKDAWASAVQAWDFADHPTDVLDNAEVYIEGTNLLNEPVIKVGRYDNLLISRDNYGSNVVVGYSMKF